MFKTNIKNIDDQIEGFINLAITFFDVKVLSIYVIGSYIDNAHIDTSDLDLVIVIDGEYDRMEKINNFFKIYSKGLFKTEIDLYVIDIKDVSGLTTADLLMREGLINMLIASQLVYGEDVRDNINNLSQDKYVASTIETPQQFMCRVRGISKSTLLDKLSLLPPDKNDKYSGYLKYGGTKQILSLIGWIGTALIAIDSGVYIGKKSDVVPIYSSHIGDSWSSYLKMSFDLIRGTLAYGIPTSEDQKERLQEICLKLPEFERYYLYKYEQFKKTQK